MRVTYSSSSGVHFPLRSMLLFFPFRRDPRPNEAKAGIMALAWTAWARGSTPPWGTAGRGSGCGGCCWVENPVVAVAVLGIPIPMGAVLVVVPAPPPSSGSMSMLSEVSNLSVAEASFPAPALAVRTPSFPTALLPVTLPAPDEDEGRRRDVVEVDKAGKGGGSCCCCWRCWGGARVAVEEGGACRYGCGNGSVGEGKAAASLEGPNATGDKAAVGGRSAGLANNTGAPTTSLLRTGTGRTGGVVGPGVVVVVWANVATAGGVGGVGACTGGVCKGSGGKAAELMLLPANDAVVCVCGGGVGVGECMVAAPNVPRTPNELIDT